MKRPTINCCKCQKPFYASFKGKYYCTTHLEEKLTELRKINAKNASTN
ncbi:MAG: hypothetical protein ACXACU_13140 [Candidatus Hodarchaeales archaeon]